MDVKPTKWGMKEFKGPESEFNAIRDEIRDIILKKRQRIYPAGIFERLDDTYEKTVSAYQAIGDERNLLFVRYNYFWLKAFEWLDSTPANSCKHLIRAFTTLKKLHSAQPLSDEALRSMAKTFRVLIVRVTEKLAEFLVSETQEDLSIQIREWSADAVKYNPYLSPLENEIGQLLTDGVEREVDALEISSGNLEKPTDQVLSLFSMINELSNHYQANHRIISGLSTSSYRLSKKELHAAVMIRFFYSNEVEKNDMQDIINQKALAMISHSEIGLKRFKKFRAGLPCDKRDDEKVRAMLAFKEIDKLSAKYYEEAYSKKDVIRAWGVLDEIREMLIRKSLVENLPLKGTILEYYCEELSMMHIFCKVCLLREEVDLAVSFNSHSWIKELLREVSGTLVSVESRFKYEMPDTKDYSLRVTSSSFAGGFSEYFIHTLFRDYHEFCSVDQNTPLEFSELLTCVKQAEDREDIVLNSVIEEGAPDIDIKIGQHSAVFLKNAPLDSLSLSGIWREINLADRHGFKNVFLGINSTKNVDKLDKIRGTLFEARAQHPRTQIDIFDIKDLVKSLLFELERKGGQKYRISASDVGRVLDY